MQTEYQKANESRQGSKGEHTGIRLRDLIEELEPSITFHPRVPQPIREAAAEFVASLLHEMPDRMRKAEEHYAEEFGPGRFRDAKEMRDFVARRMCRHCTECGLHWSTPAFGDDICDWCWGQMLDADWTRGWTDDWEVDESLSLGDSEHEKETM